MKPSPPLSKKVRWAIVLIAAAMHPILLVLLFPTLGERANLVIVPAPLAAAWLFSFGLSMVFLLLNSVVTAVVFSYLANSGPKEGLPKSIVAVLIVSLLCFGVDRLRRYLDKGRAMEAELEKIRDQDSGV
jgi:hypothetical protein